MHESESSDLEELAAAFALEALEIDESGAYRVHLSSCAVCRGLVGEFQSVVDVLPSALEVPSVSVGLKQSILAEARLDIEREVEQPSPQIAETVPDVSWRWPDWLTPKAMAVSAVVASVIIALVVWNVNLQLRLNDERDVNATQATLANAIANASSVTQLSGTDAAPDASGTLVLPSEGGAALLLVRNMPTISADREFQLWSITDAGPVSAGTFMPPIDVDRTLAFAYDFSNADAIGVSIEPIGGSAAPTGDIVLLGTR
ncbi:MAG: anti-sigma factor [Chloroflexi bacterium]|nr:anti-sigma factor [Chloroflexota bacterium]